MTADGDQTKARLLTEARDLYLEEGFAHFSLREVARRAGVSAAAVYRHYDGKEALLGQVCAQGLQIFYSYLVRALSEATPRARLAGSSTQYLRFGLENPRDYRVVFMGAAQDFQKVAPRSEGKTPEPTFQFLVDRVRECMQAGVLREGDAEEVAAVIWAHVHGLVSLRLSGHLTRAGTDAQFARFYERATDQLVAGLAR
ncbi:MAG TPA: TetR/AcrR family transcriptional regulator [Polyangiaceae bacterium]|jgi:AcrR family transcriptional regulator